MTETLRVKNYRSFMKACAQGEKETKQFVRGAFRGVGDIVKVEAADRFDKYDAKTAAGFRTVVRQRGVNVEQSLRKTTGRHPEFAGLQMREGLEPALDDKADEVREKFEDAIDKVADRFER